MTRMLLYTSPARGHLYPMMDVAIAMRAAGHQVVVQTLADQRQYVEAAGLVHRPIAPAIEALHMDDYQVRGNLRQLQTCLECWASRAAHEVDDLRRAVVDMGADLLLVDVNSWGAVAAAEASGLPWAVFLPYCLPVPSPETPAFGPGFAPPRGVAGRLRDRLVFGFEDKAFRPYIDRLSALRSGLGIPELSSSTELYTRAPLLLYRTAEPFEYPRSEWPANVRLIGPGLWGPPAEQPDWLESLPRPRTLVSVSTELQEDGAIIETALAALKDEPGSLIVTTAALDPRRFEPPHDRVRIERFVSHAAVMPHVDLVITHGGMGTTQRALAAGVPLCVVPWGRDQLESARRVEVAGAGTFVPRRKLDVARLRSAVREAAGRKPGAQRIAEAFTAAEGVARAVSLLEGLATSSRRRHPTIPNAITRGAYRRFPE